MKPNPPIQVIVVDDDGREITAFYPATLTDSELLEVIRKSPETEIKSDTPKWMLL